MTKSPNQFTKTFLAFVTGATLFIGVPERAVAQTVDTVTICFRGRTVIVPSYLLSRYIAAGATPNACVTTP